MKYKKIPCNEAINYLTDDEKILYCCSEHYEGTDIYNNSLKYCMLTAPDWKKLFFVMENGEDEWDKIENIKLSHLIENHWYIEEGK